MANHATRENRPGICVIMAGGRGTRFWPLSRSSRPKQLLDLASSRTLLRETFDRVEPLVGAQRILIVTQQDQAGAIALELPELNSHQIIGEPQGRNTAPCAALGVGIARKLFGPAPVALLPADHWIPDGAIFRRQLEAAFTNASTSCTVFTFGILPDHPATGYGYLEVSAGASGSVRAGLRFVEKPDLPTARSYLAGGRHFWNSGIFVWDSEVFQAALVEHLPALAMMLERAVTAHGGPDFDAALTQAYQDCPAVSLDYGIMENLSEFSVIEAEFSWSDLGSWDAWGKLAEDLGAGNRGRTELIARESHNNVIFAPDKTVALLGVNGLVLVETPDATLVCRTEDAQRIREIIDLIEQERREDLL